MSQKIIGTKQERKRRGEEGDKNNGDKTRAKKKGGRAIKN
jgi:hypothetical protein